MTRDDFLSGLRDSGLPSPQVNAVMEVSDALADTWADIRGGSPEEWYGDMFAALRTGGKDVAGKIQEWLFQRSSVLPWPEDSPNAVVHATLPKLSGHPDHAAAKAGDFEAAIRLVTDLIKPEKIKQIGEKFPDALIVPVQAVEAGGKNAIPRTLAHAISDISGLGLVPDIGQNNVSAHTKKGAFERLLDRANFTGKIEPGRKYVIVDDAITQGGTVSELRHYIENNGGKVVQIMTLAAGRESTVVAIKPETIKRIEEKFGREKTETILKDYDIAGNLDALTEGEGKQLLRYKDLDALRVRIDDAGYERGRNLGQGQVSSPEEVREGTPPPVSLREILFQSEMPKTPEENLARAEMRWTASFRIIPTN